MVRSAASLVLCALALAPAAGYTPTAAPTYEEAWHKEFQSLIGVMPEPTDDCSVCFFEKPHFAGLRQCLGKRDPECTDLNPIMTPGNIGSIKFGGSCELVVNMRVTDFPYNEHVETVWTDVLDTGLDPAAVDGQSAFKVYVEEAGRACFVGSVDYQLGLGKCYTEDAATLESRFQHSFYELLLFKTPTTDFDIIAFEEEGFNTGAETYAPGQEPAHAGLMSQRFSGFSKGLSMAPTNATTGSTPSMARKVASIAFVAPETPMKGQVSSTGTVAPYDSRSEIE